MAGDGGYRPPLQKPFPESSLSSCPGPGWHLTAPDQASTPGHQGDEGQDGCQQERKEDRGQMTISEITPEHQETEHCIGGEKEQAEQLHPASLALQGEIGRGCLFHVWFDRVKPESSRTARRGPPARPCYHWRKTMQTSVGSRTANSCAPHGFLAMTLELGCNHSGRFAEISA